MKSRCRVRPVDHVAIVVVFLVPPVLLALVWLLLGPPYSAVGLFGLIVNLQWVYRVVVPGKGKL